MITLAADPGRFAAVKVGLVERAARIVLRDSDIDRARISVAFLGDEEIRVMNRDYLKRDRPTDVISFALHEAGDPVVGDVYVGFEQAMRQSREHGVTLDEELVRLTVHGVLHVLGHDHPDTDREQSEFFALQERLVATICESEASHAE